MQITNLHPHLKISTKLAFLVTLLLSILGNILFILPLIILFLFELYIIIQNRYFIKQIDIQPLLQIRKILFKYLSMLLSTTFIYMVFTIFNQLTYLLELNLTNQSYYLKPYLIISIELAITASLISICMLVGSFLLELVLTKLSFKMILKYCLLLGTITFAILLISIAAHDFYPATNSILALCLIVLFIIFNESLLIKNVEILKSNKKVIFLSFIIMIYTFVILSANFLYSSLAFIFLLDVNNYLFKGNKKNSGLILFSSLVFIAIKSLFYITYLSNASFGILTILITLYTCIFFGLVLIYNFLNFSLIKSFKGAMDVWIK